MGGMLSINCDNNKSETKVDNIEPTKNNLKQLNDDNQQGGLDDNSDQYSETFLQFKKALRENGGMNLGVVVPKKEIEKEKIDIDFDPSDKFTEYELSTVAVSDTDMVDSYYDETISN